MQETHYQTADAKVSLVDSGCRRNSISSGCGTLSIRERMQEFLYHTAYAGDTLLDNGCRSLSIRQRMQKTLYQTADAGDTLSDSGCRRHSIRQRMQKSLYQTAGAGDTPSDSGSRSLSTRLIECLLHPLSYIETSASGV